LKPDYDVSCEWEEGVNERFWFLETVLDYKGMLYPGWLYYPFPGPLKKHRDTTIEFLAEWIEGIKSGETVKVKYSLEKLKIVREREQ
jgi:hypothetical protein